MQADYLGFQELNAEILAISVEDSAVGQHVSDLLDLQYPVLSDADHRVTDQYGVYNLLGDSLATPSVFIIDLEGIIRWDYVGQSTSDRPSNQMILEQLRSLPASD
ncbi:MAG: redoxin domain-containing protein [Anaerolineae bacterium]|nr:redoxin domain-containing protein [Anaerolineae bacterium]NIO00291.1 redoxin domain-containing protein [Anaerolineae bacterium]NIQ83073.1 redoxin domain-containing protein [Anaerolineae bacterium]